MFFLEQGFEEVVEHGHAGVGIVQAGDDGVSLAAGGEEGVASGDGEFFQGFHAIGRKGGADDRGVGDAVFGQVFNHIGEVGFQPFGFAEAGLEGEQERRQVVFVG